MAKHSYISSLENPTDRGAWHVIVPGVTKNQPRLSMHTMPDAACRSLEI